MKDDTWIEGTVIRGDGRGHDLGFPTANIALDNPETRPQNGIYACWARIEKKETQFKAALHVGPVPTFNKNTATVELHLLNYSGDNLYGEKIYFLCVKYLRDIVKFDTIEQLQSALEQDCQLTNEILSN